MDFFNSIIDFFKNLPKEYYAYGLAGVIGLWILLALVSKIKKSKKSKKSSDSTKTTKEVTTTTPKIKSVSTLKTDNDAYGTGIRTFNSKDKDGNAITGIYITDKNRTLFYNPETKHFAAVPLEHVADFENANNPWKKVEITK